MSSTLSSVALVEELQARNREVDPLVNAICTPNPAALTQAAVAAALARGFSPLTNKVVGRGVTFLTKTDVYLKKSTINVGLYFPPKLYPTTEP